MRPRTISDMFGNSTVIPGEAIELAEKLKILVLTGGVLVHQPPVPASSGYSPDDFEYARPAPRPNRAARRREGHRARRRRA